MNTPIDDLIRSTLTDLAKEAVPMNLADSAVARARRRRTLTVSVGVAGVVAALMIGTPLAMAAVNRDATPPSAPADQPPADFPSPSPINPGPSAPQDLPGIPPISPDPSSPVASPVPISPVPFPPVDPKGPGTGS